MGDNTYRRRIGDRKDGRLLRSFPAYNKFTPFIMKQRNDACNYFSDKVEVTEIDRWLRMKRAEGYTGLGMLHLFVAAYIRTIAVWPGINRFVSGQHIYARNNIEILMTVKHALTAEAEESSIKVKFEPTDTIYDVYRKMNDAIDEVKVSEGGNSTDKIAETFSKLPRVLINLIISILKGLDYLGWMPQSIVDASPFHGSLIITDLGSIGIPPVYHHIYNFGNLPVFLAFGAKYRMLELDLNGNPVERKYIDFRVTADERTTDGFYLANALKYVKYFLRNPGILETPPEQVKQDIF